MSKICPSCKRECWDKDKYCPACKRYLGNTASNNNQVENKTPVNVNIPKCPTCGSTNVKSISMGNRWLSVGLFGLASGKIGKSMECKNCSYKW